MGLLKYPERVMPRLTLPLHCLAKVMSNPPPEANLALKLVAEMAWSHRDEGITYCGGEPSMSLSLRARVKLDEPAPVELQGTADATWGAVGPEKDISGMVLTRCGGAVVHGTNNINAIVDSSCESEGVASTKLAHKIEYAQTIESAFGATVQRPTILGTDSSSNLALATRQGAAGRARHALRRWHNLIRRLELGQVLLAKVDTDDMPADFLTKFVPTAKLERSIRRATNAGAAVPPART